MNRVQPLRVDLGAVEIELRRKLPNEYGGFTTRAIGKRRGTVTAVIDLSKLAYLAERAVRSKRRRATALHGAVVLKAEGVVDDLHGAAL